MCLCFAVSGIFFSKHDFRLDPFFLRSLSAGFRDFPGKRVFQNPGRCEHNTLHLPVLCCLRDFVCQNTSFDLTRFARSSSAGSVIFVETVVFKIRVDANTPLVVDCVLLSPVLFQDTMSDLTPVFVLVVRVVFHGFRGKYVSQNSGNIEQYIMSACVLIRPIFRNIKRCDLTPVFTIAYHA